MERKVNIVEDLEGKKIVMIHDIRFKGKRREEWNEVEEYLKEYIGDRLALKGAVAKAKANATQGIPELIQIATNVEYSENTKKNTKKMLNLGGTDMMLDLRFRCMMNCREKC